MVSRKDRRENRRARKGDILNFSPFYASGSCRTRPLREIIIKIHSIGYFYIIVKL
jgi:hypothetical protein